MSWMSRDTEDVGIRQLLHSADGRPQSFSGASAHPNSCRVLETALATMCRLFRVDFTTAHALHVALPAGGQ